MIGLQDDVSPAQAEDFSDIVDVWEASVRATHHFVTEADIQFFKPLVHGALPVLSLACVRQDKDGVVVGFVAVGGGKVEMLFIHPLWREQGIGRRLLSYVVDTTTLDVNEQNEQALGLYLHMHLDANE